MFRTLIHYWRMNLAVLAGAAVATAVLAGALVVGDSVRRSLRELTLERLGKIDHALAGQRFFREQLAQDLAEHPEFQARFSAAAPAILLSGSAQHAATRARASKVGIQGVDERFLGFFPEVGGEAGALLAQAEGIFPPAVINEALAGALGAAAGDDVLIALKRWSAVPEGSLLGRKDTSSVVETVRLTVAGVIPDRGLGRFGLAVQQGTAYNLFVPLAALQKELDQEGTINGVVVADRVSLENAGAGAAEGGSQILDAALRAVLAPEDVGLIFTLRDGVLQLESEEYILKSSLVAAVEESGAETFPILTYLVNRFALGEREVPYSTVTAMPTAADPVFGQLLLVDGTPAPELGDDEILLNDWTAERLGAAVGDTLELTYFVVGPREDLREETTRLRVAGVAPVAGLAADDGLAQEYPGIAGNDNMADWDPPFPFDLGKVGDADEDYWDRYRDTPKAFVNPDLGRRLWKNRWGELTAIRVALTLPGFESGLVKTLPLEAYGLVFQPVKELGLGASGGATDFGGLFIGFSMFLIASAAMLVALLFSLGVEQRASQVGLLRAVGYPAAKVRRGLLMEGVAVAAAGALAGLAGAVAYAGAMMHGLRTWWLPAVGTSRLELHVEPATLAAGYLISLLVVVLAIWLRVRQLRKVSTPALLARVSEPPETRSGKRAGWVAAICLGVALALVAFAFATGRTSDPAVFGSAGPALLIGLLALFARRLGGGPGARGGDGLGRPGTAAVMRMAAASGARSRGRSILSATLVASASFLIVTVAAYQTDFSRMRFDKDSGTGGYALIGESDVPLLYDPGDPDGRFELGMDEDAEAVLLESRIVPMRLLPGDDTSCLNLYQPTQPRILGVPQEIVDGGGFVFQSTIEEVENPWTLLERDYGPGVIPAIGDANSMQWILKLGLGKDLVMENEAGEEIRLRLVAMIGTAVSPSIFQSEMLIAERHFLEHFPGTSGWSYFLVEAGGDDDAVAQALEGSLADYGFDAVPAAEKLESFHAVQNTYLSTFRTLGGLGLLLGTVGLAIVLLRNTIERRGELAALRAFGYRRRTVTLMVVLENGLLLVVGLAIGTLAALVTAAPNLLSEASVFPARAIATTLAAILVFGLAACSLAAFGALRIPLMPALKAER